MTFHDTAHEPVFSRREVETGAWLVALFAGLVLVGSLVLAAPSGPERTPYAHSAGIADAQPIEDAQGG